MNSNGECRLIIYGKGEFKRWQVTIRALEANFLGDCALD